MAVAAEEFEILRPFAAFGAVMQMAHFTGYGPAAAILAPVVSPGNDCVISAVRNAVFDARPYAQRRPRRGASAHPRSLHRDPEGRERKPEAPARRRREAGSARNREGGRSDRGVFGHHETAHGAGGRAHQPWLRRLVGCRPAATTATRRLPRLAAEYSSMSSAYPLTTLP